MSGDANGQARAIEEAVQADPTTPNVAWEAANLYMVEGQTAAASPHPIEARHGVRRARSSHRQEPDLEGPAAQAAS